jgi:hypothetical protein
MDTTFRDPAQQTEPAMIIYKILMFLIILIATTSGIFLLRRRKLLCSIISIAFFYFAVIYALSLLGVPTFVTRDELTLGAWVRPMLPVILAGPIIYCHD